MASGYPDWLRAFSMLGKYGDDYKVVAVDGSGNLYALLQGETVDEELRTVRLDDEGRLSAFVIDSTDAWNRMLTIGNAELAVRLGSPVAYDRRGQVILAQDFEDGWGSWKLCLSGNNAAGALDPTTAATGGYSAKLTAGEDVSLYSYVQIRRGLLPVGRIGAEFSFAVPGTVNFVQIYLLIDDGIALYQCEFQWWQTGGLLKVFDHDAGWVNVGTAELAEADFKVFNTAKIVCDLTTGEYARLLFNQQEIDISEYDVRHMAPGAEPRITLSVGVYGTGGVGEIAYVDDIILTFGEP